MSTSDAGWERLFWLIFERSLNPIAIVDERRRVLEVNEAGAALLGRGREQLHGSSLVDSVIPSERERSTQEWQRFLSTGQYSGSRALARGDGSDVRVDFAAALATVGGRRVAVYVMMPWDGRVEAASSAGEPPLTKREREVVTLIALGNDTGAIAERLHIAPETVRTHVRNAMGKLKARTRAQLVAIALCSDEAIHVPSVHEQAS